MPGLERLVCRPPNLVWQILNTGAATYFRNKDLCPHLNYIITSTFLFTNKQPTLWESLILPRAVTVPAGTWLWGSASRALSHYAPFRPRLDHTHTARWRRVTAHQERRVVVSNSDHEPTVDSNHSEIKLLFVHFKSLVHTQNRHNCKRI